MIARFAAAVGIVIFMTGCVGVFNPYVRTEANDPHPFQSSTITLDAALSYAHKVRARYREALANQGLLSNGIGSAIIPLTGIVAYQGITGRSTHAIAATSVGGAAILGTGTYLQSASRQSIYAEAAAAITCATAIVAPMRLPAGEYERLKVALDDKLPKALQKLSTLGDPTARALAADIGRALATGRTARANVDDAGIRLINAVEAVVDQADKQLAATTPDLRALASGLGGLIALPKIAPTDLPTVSPKPSATEMSGTTPTDAALSQINTSEAEIRDQIALIASIAERLKDAPVKAGLASCTAAMEQLNTGLRTVPDSTTITLSAGKADEYHAFVFGGQKKAYSAHVLRKPETGSLTAEVLSGSPYQLRIRTDAKVPPGDFLVALKDDPNTDPIILTVRVQK